MTNSELINLTRLLRRWVLQSTTAAGSGHPTSCLSAVEALTTLFFGGSWRAYLADPDYPTNDRLVLSKGHAAPLLYALYAAAGVIPSEELLRLRQAGSPLQGHPLPGAWPYVPVATGSLGQGLGVGAGLALAARWRNLPTRTVVLLGDGEWMEGSNHEILALAAHEGLDNLVAAVDVNRLGQRGPTMWGHDLEKYRAVGAAHGWRVLVAKDGHDLEELVPLWEEALRPTGHPTLVLLPTVKGKGVSFLEDQVDWHGRAVPSDRLEEALAELGEVDEGQRGQVAEPPLYQAGSSSASARPAWRSYGLGEQVSPREAVGEALATLVEAEGKTAVLDAEVANSTYFNRAAEQAPERFFEAYIAEQAMIGVATGLAVGGYQPWAGTFAAFLTRAADQLRLAHYSGVNLKIIGTHAGVSIGADGPSQMGLEDIALFRALGAKVYSPADAVSAQSCVKLAAEEEGLVYIRCARGEVPVLYEPGTVFTSGGAQVMRQSADDVVAIIATGATVHEALTAADRLADAGLPARVIDLYSLFPVDESVITQAGRDTKLIIAVEDHVAAGGLGEIVAGVLARNPGEATLRHLCVRHIPGSASPAEQLARAKIDAVAITTTATEYLSSARLRYSKQKT